MNQVGVPTYLSYFGFYSVLLIMVFIFYSTDLLIRVWFFHVRFSDNCVLFGLFLTLFVRHQPVFTLL